MMLWSAGPYRFDLSSRAVVMGILNATPDSFSDGSRFLDPQAALDRALEMEAAGAEIIDVGGESTRPGSPPVSPEEELARVTPVLQALSGRLRAALSIDTRRAAVARVALDLGVVILNDVTALRGDPEMAPLAARSGAGVVLMHAASSERLHEKMPPGDPIPPLREFFLQSRAHALRWGIAEERIVFDPGFGFGKSAAQQLVLLRRLPELLSERPLLLGLSRKSFLKTVNPNLTTDERLWPTVATTCLGRAAGARIFRVHDIRPNVEALRFVEATLAS